MSNFKYSILINQKAIIDNNLGIDFTDAIIFDFIHYFANSKHTKRMSDGGHEYFFLHWSKIIEQLPLLGINTRQGIHKRLQNLVNAKLIEPHSENGNGTGYVWYRLGDNYDLMFVTDSNNSYNLSTKVATPVNESYAKVKKPVNESLPYNTIDNKTIKDKTTTIKEVVDVPDFVKKEKEEFKQQALDYQKESNRLDAEQTKDLIRNNASLKEELIKFFTRTTLYKQADKQAHDKIRLNIRLKEFFEIVLDEHITRNKSEELYPRKSSESVKHFRNYFKKKIDNLSEGEYRQFLKLLIS